MMCSGRSAMTASLEHPALVRLVRQRLALLRTMAGLRRVGASYIDRAARNKKIAQHRKTLRKQLKKNANAILAYVMQRHEMANLLEE